MLINKVHHTHCNSTVVISIDCTPHMQRGGGKAAGDDAAGWGWGGQRGWRRTETMELREGEFERFSPYWGSITPSCPHH